MNVKLTSNVFICIYMPEMSISLSETGRSVYVSDSLPPCFFNILASGPTNNNKRAQSITVDGVFVLLYYHLVIQFVYCKRVK